MTQCHTAMKRPSPESHRGCWARSPGAQHPVLPLFPRQLFQNRTMPSRALCVCVFSPARRTVARCGVAGRKLSRDSEPGAEVRVLRLPLTCATLAGIAPLHEAICFCDVRRRVSLLSGLGAGSVRRRSGTVLGTTCRVVGTEGTKAASGRLFLIWADPYAESCLFMPHLLL